MARARNIKPALFKNELLGVADPYITLLFQSLWMLADREGRLEDRPLRIKAETFPYRENLDINGYLTELQRLGFIVRYVVGNLALIQIINFKKHQTPHNTEKPSELPDVTLGIVSTCGSQHTFVNSPLNNEKKTQALPPDSLIPDSLLLNPSLLIPDIKRKKSLDGYTPEFEQAWSEYPAKEKDSKKAAFKAWTARLNNGVDIDLMLNGVKRYAAYVIASGTESKYVKQAATFFGPDEHYLTAWTITQSTAQKKQEKFEPTAYVNRKKEPANERTITFDQFGEPF